MSTDKTLPGDKGALMPRRGFMIAALSAPALAVAAATEASLPAAQPVAADAAPPAPSDGRYHETEHIRRYYALAARY